MTTDPRAEWIERLAREIAYRNSWPVDMGRQAARIAADFAERLCRARDEQIHDEQTGEWQVLNADGMARLPLPWAEAMQEEKP
jgi:hypothetical protein